MQSESTTILGDDPRPAEPLKIPTIPTVDVRQHRHVFVQGDLTTALRTVKEMGLKWIGFRRFYDSRSGLSIFRVKCMRPTA